MTILSIAPGAQAPSEIVVTDPATGAEVGRVPVHGRDHVAAAVDAARAAQASWAMRPIAERARVLRRVRRTMLLRARDLVDVIVRENGKPRDEAVLLEVLPSALVAAYTTSRGPRLLKPRRVSGFIPLFPRRAELVRAPRGVVGLISPWNYPLVIPLSTVFPALLAGNAVVWKPSELTPLTALVLRDLAAQAGLPAGLLQVVTGFGETGRHLVEAGVDMVSFTGSTATGRRIAALCGERLIPCTLELGGKAPCIVLPDADVERAARAIVYGGFANLGQTCVSVERVFVHERLHDRLVERVVALASSLRRGRDLGAMTSARQADHVRRLVDDAARRGARVIVTGPMEGRHLSAVVVADADPGLECLQQEIFGPVVPFVKVKDDDEAVRLANAHELGLNAYVFGKDRRRARAVAARLRVGAVMINDVMSNYGMAELPFGGVKGSGTGRVHGEAGLLSLVEERVVVRNRFFTPRREPWWFPYDGRLSDGLLLGLARAMDLLDLVARRPW